jgi:hypothetical protein
MIMSTQPIEPAPKPGIKTTEFWLNLAAQVCGALMASGMFAPGSIVVQIVGLVSMVLAGLGYTWSRAIAKGGKK